MSKKIYLFSLVLLSLVFVSCEETKEEGKYDNWRARNEAFIDSLANVYATVPGRGGLESFHTITSGVPIYYKKKTPVGDGIIQDVTPLYTSTVTVYYKGSYIIGYVDAKNNFIGEVFDGTFLEADPSIDFSRTVSFSVNDFVPGFTDMLQRMKVGERWEVYIPWKYGYGSNDYTPTGSSITIPGYSTLIFDVQLLESEN